MIDTYECDTIFTRIPSKISYFHIPEIEDRMKIDAYDLRDNKWNLMVLLRKYLF